MGRGKHMGSLREEPVQTIKKNEEKRKLFNRSQTKYAKHSSIVDNIGFNFWNFTKRVCYFYTVPRPRESVTTLMLHNSRQWL